MRRAILLAVMAAGLAPGTWWRSPPHLDFRQTLNIRSLGRLPLSAGEMNLVGAWELRSSNSDFHGYSALTGLRDGMLLALSDRGRMLRFTPPDRSLGPPVLKPFSATRAGDEKRQADIEALAHDPRTGRIWAAYEHSNAIERHTPAGQRRRARPAAMRDWPENAGPEAMVRLADGRFIVLSEGSPTWMGGATHGLLFPNDPVQGAEPIRFRFERPSGFRPVDMAQLPDGRVLVLVRSVEGILPPRFSNKLVLVDPTQISPGSVWRGEVVAEIAEPLPTENYEGLAIEPETAGNVILWLISDDNQSAFQRTLLLKLRWRPKEKARGVSRAPS